MRENVNSRLTRKMLSSENVEKRSAFRSSSGAKGQAQIPVGSAASRSP